MCLYVLISGAGVAGVAVMIQAQAVQVQVPDIPK
jgi:hypothetical protein